MSLFFSRVWKLSSRRAHHRFFSTPSVSCSLHMDRSHNVSFAITAAEKPIEDRLLIKDRKLPDQIGCLPLGISRGWVTFVYMKEGGLVIRVTDLFKPLVSSAKSIPLPPLGFEPKPFISQISHSCPHLCGHCLVAGIFTEQLLSVCTPSSDKWTHIEDHSEMSLLPACKLIYSNTHKTFYFTSDWSFQLGSVDVSNKKLVSHSVRFGSLSLSKIRDREWSVLNDCTMTKHLVESPSGQFFYIICYVQYPPMRGRYRPEFDNNCCKLKRFMVFKQEEKSKEFHYTEDIGDLSIFLSHGIKGEDFCVTASMYPVLKPNTIHYLSNTVYTGNSTYDIASRKFRSCFSRAVFWISPN